MQTKIFHSLTEQLLGQTDYWRIAHYGFTVDDGPFIFNTYGGEFEAKIKVSGDYKVRFSDFKVKHIPDQRRVEWLKNNQ